MLLLCFKLLSCLVANTSDTSVMYEKAKFVCLYLMRPQKMKFESVQMKKVNKQCLLDTPRTVRVSEKTWQVIVQTRRP